jgi:lysophospholipase L1-like esterase
MRMVWVAVAVLAGVLLVAEGALQVASLLAKDRSMPGRGGVTQRILCIGDSHTYGAGVEPTKSYPAQLQRRLDEAEPGRHSVTNLGVPGMNTSQLRHRVPDWLADYEPDVLIVWAGVNNAWNSAEVDAAPTSIQDRLDRILLRSRLYKLVRVQLHSGELERQVEHQRDTEGDASRVEPRARDDFHAIADLARNEGIRLVFVTYPVSLGWFAEANRAMWQVARERDLFIVDSSASLDRVPLEKREWLWGMHPGADSYAEIARDVAAVVLDREGRIGRARSLTDPQPTPAELEIMLRAFKTLAIEAGPMTPEERARLDNFQKLAKTDFDLDTLAPLGPAELAAALTAGAKRRRVIDALTELARTDGETQPGEQSLIDAYERAFGAASK